MLPPNKSEFDQQHVDGQNLEEQMHATQASRVDHEDDLVDSETELDSDADAILDDDPDDINQEAEEKPKKKGMSKGIIAAVGAAVVVALSGATYFYFMQGQPKTTAPISKKIAVDPSLTEAKPALNAPQAPILGTEVTPNLSPRSDSPVGTLPSSISAPPSDPFSGSATAPTPSVVAPGLAPTPAVVIAPGLAPTPAVVIAPVVALTPPVVITSAPTPAPAVIIIAAPVANVEGPRADPFGAVVVKGAPKIEKPTTVEKLPKPIAEPVVKAAKPIKIVKKKAAEVDAEEVEIVKPRVVKKVIAKKPSVVRQDMTRSEPHPSQERVQPQSSENFSGYEKLF